MAGKWQIGIGTLRPWFQAWYFLCHVHTKIAYFSWHGHWVGTKLCLIGDSRAHGTACSRFGCVCHLESFSYLSPSSPFMTENVFGKTQWMSTLGSNPVSLRTLGHPCTFRTQGHPCNLRTQGHPGTFRIPSSRDINKSTSPKADQFHTLSFTEDLGTLNLRCSGTRWHDSTGSDCSLNHLRKPLNNQL